MDRRWWNRDAFTGRRDDLPVAERGNSPMGTDQQIATPGASTHSQQT